MVITRTTAEDTLATVAAIDGLGGVGIPFVCDHRDDDAVERLFERIRAEHGRLDVLVNNVYNSPAAAHLNDRACRVRRRRRQQPQHRLRYFLWCAGPLHRN